LKKNSIAVLLLVYVLFSVAFTFIPASADADDDANFLQLLLDQSSDQVNDKISELEDAGITIPSSVDSFYSQGLAGYESALASIEEGNLDEAQEHAFEAMSLFEDALEGLFEAEEDFGDQVDGNTDEINELVDTISNSEIDADEIRDLAIQNDLDISFGDYDDAIEDAKALLAGGDLEGANQQFENAEDLLEDAFDQIDEGIDLQQDDRVDEFVTSTILQLEGIIEGAKGLGIAQSFIDELQETLDIIKNAESTDDILAVTGPSSALNNLISELTPVGPPDGVPGQGPPDGVPGQGPPDGVPGLDDEDVSTFDDENCEICDDPDVSFEDNIDRDIDNEVANVAKDIAAGVKEKAKAGAGGEEVSEVARQTGEKVASTAKEQVQPPDELPCPARNPNC